MLNCPAANVARVWALDSGGNTANSWPRVLSESNNLVANLLTLQNQDKRLAASFAPLKIIAKNVGAISLA
jgi:hypothetical protein